MYSSSAIISVGTSLLFMNNCITGKTPFSTGVVFFSPFCPASDSTVWFHPTTTFANVVTPIIRGAGRRRRRPLDYIKKKGRFQINGFVNSFCKFLRAHALVKSSKSVNGVLLKLTVPCTAVPPRQVGEPTILENRWGTSHKRCPLGLWIATVP